MKKVEKVQEEKFSQRYRQYFKLKNYFSPRVVGEKKIIQKKNICIEEKGRTSEIEQYDICSCLKFKNINQINTL